MRKFPWILVAVLMVPAFALAHHGYSPYAGQEKRAMKTVSEEEMRALLNGQGMGLAKAAERLR